MMVMITAVFLTACRPEPIPPTPILLATIPAELAAQAALNRPPTPMITPRAEEETLSVELVETAVAPPADTLLAGETWRVGIASNVPKGLAQEVEAFAGRHSDRFSWVGDGDADLVVALGDERPFATWIFAAAAPFATVTDDVGLADLQSAWQGSGQPLVVDSATAGWLADKWGSASSHVFFTSPEKRMDMVWQKRPSWSIVPFDELQPELKVLRLDGQSPLTPDFRASEYGLQANVSAVGDDTSASSGQAVSEFLSAWDGPTSNRDAAKLTRVAITGVTALVRATAYNMEQNGMLWPAEDVGPVLQAADIAHVSNEVSFASDCPYPNPIGGTTFCSGDNTFELLKYIGTDVVELTGNHLNDWGSENLARSLEMFEAAGMATYGGGRNATEAAVPALFEHNGNKIAFVGCNSFGPTYAWAGADSPGARQCDGSMVAQIRQLTADGYQVIATLQGTEYYQYPAMPEQQTQFRALAEAGATAVSGSQAHHLQAFDFHNGSFIHYGPGNLFFDQMDQLGTRQTLVDTYTFYNGRLLSVDLWTGLIESYAKPRLMTPEEREQTLTTVFQASGW